MDVAVAVVAANGVAVPVAAASGVAVGVVVAVAVAAGVAVSVAGTEVWPSAAGAVAAISQVAAASAARSARRPVRRPADVRIDKELRVGNTLPPYVPCEPTTGVVAR